MRIVFFTDMHIKFNKPSSRLDINYLDTCLKKLNFIIKTTNNLNPDIVIFGGDLFDKPNISNSTIIDTIKEISNLQKPLYVVIGNHDIMGYSKDSLYSSAIGILIETKVCKLLEEEIIGNVRIKAMHCYDKEVFDDIKQGYLNILVAHKPITNINIPSKIDLTNLLTINKYDIILSGDIHMPHLIEYNNKYFINPGAAVRTSLVEKEREPKFLVLDITDKITYKLITIPHQKNIFISTANKTNVLDDSFITDYIDKINKTKVEKISLEEQIEQYIIQNNIPDNIKHLIFNYLSKAREEE